MEPFKVICVKVADDWKWMKGFFGINYPDVGTECTVEKKSLCGCGKHDQYQLTGFPDALYTDHCFATLPGLTADEMNELTRESIIR